jgi:hypothetical protein
VFLSLLTKQPVRSADGLREKPRTKAAETNPRTKLSPFAGASGFSGENHRTERDLRRGTSATNQASVDGLATDDKN